MILIDDRKGSKEFYPKLSKLTTCELSRLEFADFAFIGNGRGNKTYSIGVERKTIPDFIDSMHSGRLSGHQLSGLLKHYDIVYILLEGIWKEAPLTNKLIRFDKKRKGPVDLDFSGKAVTSRQINNFANSITINAALEYNCTVLFWRTPNQSQSVSWLRDTYLWWQKDFNKHSSHKQLQKPKEPRRAGLLNFQKPSTLQMMLMGVPDLGEKKSKVLSERFKTMQELVTAPVEDIAELHGFSKASAVKLLNVLMHGGDENDGTI